MQDASGIDAARQGKKLPGMWTVGVNSVRHEGWRVLFAGLTPTIVR